jgi:hypothetical protein
MTETYGFAAIRSAKFAGVFPYSSWRSLPRSRVVVKFRTTLALGVRAWLLSFGLGVKRLMAATALDTQLFQNISTQTAGFRLKGGQYGVGVQGTFGGQISRSRCSARTVAIMSRSARRLRRAFR